MPASAFVLDGELCVLEDTFKASFHAIQKRGNSRNAEIVQTLSQEIPAVFIAFDVLHSKDSLHGLPFSQRRSVLETVVNSTLESKSQTHYAKIIKTLSCKDHQTLWHTIEKQNGEGIVAKKNDSLGQAEKGLKNG